MHTGGKNKTYYSYLELNSVELLKLLSAKSSIMSLFSSCRVKLFLFWNNFIELTID